MLSWIRLECSGAELVRNENKKKNKKNKEGKEKKVNELDSWGEFADLSNVCYPIFVIFSFDQCNFLIANRILLSVW